MRKNGRYANPAMGEDQAFTAVIVTVPDGNPAEPVTAPIIMRLVINARALATEVHYGNVATVTVPRNTRSGFSIEIFDPGERSGSVNLPATPPKNGHKSGHSSQNKGPIISDRPSLTALFSMVRRGGLEPPRDCSR